MRMSKIIAGGCAIMLFFAVSTSGHTEEPEHEFIGSKKCSLCHKREKHGNQYRIWQESKHSKAFETLATPEARVLAGNLGIDDPQKSGECLRCHSTAYRFSTKKVTEKISTEEGVGYEACHGPGKDYMKISTMKNRQKAIDAGLIIPNEKTCRKCHNETAPNAKEFNYKEFWGKIKHPISQE